MSAHILHLTRFEGANPKPGRFGFCFRLITVLLIDHLIDESGEDLGGHVWIDELMRETGGEFLFAKVGVRALAYSIIF